MGQVILIEKNKVLNDLISINLTSYLGVDIIHRIDAKETILLLNILPHIELIICPQSLDSENTSEMLSQYIVKNELSTSLIVLGANTKPKNDFTVNVDSPNNWEEIISVSGKILGINEDSLARKIKPDYTTIPVKYFLNLETVNCDVFIRVKKSPSNYQYIKRIHNNDTFSKESIHRYIEQGLENFYIAKDDSKIFSIFLSNKLIEIIDNPELEINQKIQIMGDSFDIAIKDIIELGFNSETVQLTDTIIQNMIKNFEKSPEMSSLLHKIVNSKTGSIYQRSHMTSIVAGQILKNLKINDQSAYVKIAYASFFNDITLTDNIHLSNINSFGELENANLDESDWEVVFNHPNDAVALLYKHPNCPTGVDEIIKNHHGSSNGKGFSNSIEKLPELSKVFIIAYYFVLELMRFKELGGKPKPITEELYKKYPGASVLIILKALEQTLKKKK